MKDKGVNLHKRLACGDTIKGYKHGGHVAVGQGTKLSVATSASKPVTVRSMVDLKANPLTMARRNNGVKGMSEGGKVKK